MARELSIKIVVDNSQSKPALLETEKQIGGVTTAVEKTKGPLDNLGARVLAAFSVGAVIAFGRQIAAFASEMQDLSARTGLGVETLQALNYAAAGSNVAIGTLADGMAQLSKRLTSDEGGGAVRALEQLGINADKFISLPFDRQLIAIATGMQNIQNPMQQNAIAMELFGRAGAQFLPLLKEDIAALTEEAQRNGAVMDEALIKKADALDDAWARLVIRAKALAVEVVTNPFFWDTQSASLLRTVGSIYTFVTAGNAAEDVLKRIGRATIPIAPGLESVALSFGEAAKVAAQLDKEIKDQINKTLEEHAKKVAAAEAAHRAFTNWIGEREIEAIKELDEAYKKSSMEAFQLDLDTLNQRLESKREFYAEQNALEDQAIESAISAGHAYAAIMAEDDARWRAHTNFIGERLMEQDRLTMEHTESMRLSWRQFGKDVGEQVSTLMGLVTEALGPGMGRAVGLMKAAWDNGRTLMSGIGKMMAGDFSGLVDTIMSGIGLIKNAWGALKGLFQSEETKLVNAPRDEFFAQYGGFDGLAAKLGEFVAGDVAERLIKNLYAADTQRDFHNAQDDIIAIVGGQKFHQGGMVPGTGEVFGRLLGGERVLNREETKVYNQSQGGMNITVAPGAIVINGTGKDAPTLARELWPALMTEARRDYKGVKTGMRKLLVPA